MLLEEARRRNGQLAELPLLLGTALYGAGRAEEALPLLVEAAGKSEKQMYGEAYLVAGKALRALGRFAEAEDAFARYLAINSSSVEGRVLFACVKRELKDTPAGEGGDARRARYVCGGAALSPSRGAEVVPARALDDARAGIAVRI